MNCKTRALLTIFIGIVFAIFLFPTRGFAVDYSITDVKIDAYLQENGNIDVKETHTYSFEGDFGGITRELFPKEGTTITEFAAEENGKALKIEKGDHLYKVHRKGENETITVDLTYSIKNGVHVYSDSAEFYWPFFDERNESTYENLTVTIHPPAKTDDVIAFGYEEAFETEEIHSDGSVVFQFGKVPSGENGDIRVAYDASLFPSATQKADTAMKEEILAAKQGLIDEAAARLEMQEKLGKIAEVIIPTFTAILIIMMFITYMKARLKKEAVQRELHTGFFAPKQTISIPATIYFTNNYQLPADAMAAAFLDLVRQGYVEKLDENRFKINEHKEPLLKHEQVLMKFLFDEVGTNGKFSFEDLTAYIKEEKNHGTYHSKLTEWRQAVIKEVKGSELYEKKTKFRSIVGLSSLVLLPFLFLFPAYGLFGWFAGTLVLFFTVIFYASFYKPKTWKGLMVTYEWRSLKNHLKELSEGEWEALSEDEQMRVYLYSIGINDNRFAKNEQMVESFKAPATGILGEPGSHTAANLSTLYFFGPIATSSFQSADKTTASTINTTTSTGGGGGVGGGGGGSGAF